LEEVDGWTGFTAEFTHLYTGQPMLDRTGLLTAILADATNLGKTRMADAAEDCSADRLAWIEDWYIREANYTRALAAIIKRQGEFPWPHSGGADAPLLLTVKLSPLPSVSR